MNTLGEILVALAIVIILNWIVYSLVLILVRKAVDIAVDKTTQYYRDQINILIGRLEEKNKE